MKKRLLIVFQMATAGVALGQAAVPDSTYNSFTAEEITVTGKRGDVLQKATDEKSRLLDPSQMSLYRSINLMPSLSQQSVDPYGLADISNYHESFRFRGVEATSGGVPATTVNVEDLPLTGRPGGGAMIYDIENFTDFNIYTGAIPADKGLGLANVGGKIEMNAIRPNDEAGVFVKQSAGSSNFFRKTFIRLNSGKLPLDIQALGSYSNSYGDKWKGDGSTTRQNAMFGLVKAFGTVAKVEAFTIYNKANIHTYRPLKYAQVSDLDKNYNTDYSNDPGSYDYYDYNRNKFEDWALFANAEFNVTKNSKLHIKPYYWSDKGYYLETITLKDGQNRVRRWDINHDAKGVLSQYNFKLSGADLNVGYLYHTQERPGPPTSWKNYKVVSGKLVFDSWALLSNTSSHDLHSPFIAGKYIIGKFLVEGGLKYLNYKMPSMITYKTKGIGDVSYEEALKLSSGVEDSASVMSARTITGLFPHLSVSLFLKDNLSAHVSYGKNYVNHVDIYPYFLSQRSMFYGKKISFEQIWDEREMEVSHNFELGFRYATDTWRIVPTLYYAIHNNKQAVLYDPAVDAIYPRNAADARAYGIEIETEVKPAENLTCYGSFSWNRFYFAQNISSATGSTLDVEGNQVPDAPEFLVKALVSYKLGDFTFTPIMRYTSSRYGDILQKEKVDGFALVDFDVNYNTALFGLRNVDLSLTFLNIFDKKYVSIISTSDYKTLASSYQTGSPFTVVGSISVSY